MSLIETVRVHVSGVVPNVSSQEVWSLVGSFNGLPRWYDTVAMSEMENDQSENSIGGIRKLTLKNGTIQRESLVAMNLLDRSYTYSIVDGVPWDGYKNDYFATLSVKDITTIGFNKVEQTLIEWKAEFSCPLGETEKWKQLIEQIFEYGIQCLQKLYNNQTNGLVKLL